MGKVRVNITDLTPELATQLMEHNVGNRRCDDKIVAMYAKDMSEGRWHENGQPITISNGILKSGQHRCKAVIKSGVTLHNTVFIYTDDAEMIDTNKTRSVRDLSGIDNVTSAAVTTIIKMSKDCHTDRISKDVIIKMCRRWGDSCEYITHRFQKKQAGLRKAGVIGACIAAHLVGYPEHLLDSFISAFTTGFMSKDIDKTAVALRNAALTQNGGGRYMQRVLYLKTQSALKSYAVGRSLERIHELKEPCYSPEVDL